MLGGRRRRTGRTSEYIAYLKGLDCHYLHPLRFLERPTEVLYHVDPPFLCAVLALIVRSPHSSPLPSTYLG